MRLLIPGGGGMLAHDVVRAATRAGHEPLALGRDELDVSDRTSVDAAFERHRPDAAINCAAWTDVDGAEEHEDLARAVNGDGAAHLARAAATARIPLVHVSTDYVFDGTATRPYVESDPTGPRSAYGRTKLAGEVAVVAASPRHAVVRTAWLFGVAGGNFAATMLRLAGERDEVRVVADQVGSPTWTGHLAPALLGLLEREVAGVVHAAGAGACSWHAFAAEIFRQAEVGCRAVETTTAEFPRPAPRPAYSVLESERDDVLEMPDWRDGLAGYLAARAGFHAEAPR